MMMILRISLLLVVCAGAFQPANAWQSEADPVSQQASQWEADLGQLQDRSAEAAAVMLNLVELYHDHGRVLGLIRIGNRFVLSHPTHPRHAEIMLKLIEGLQAGSRNEDLLNMGRQFLSRYPEHQACGQVELTVALVLEELNKRPEAAEAYRALWQRLGKTPEGRQAGVDAIRRFSSLKNRDAYLSAAKTAEEMFRSIGQGVLATQCSQQAISLYERAGRWSEANAVAREMLRRKVRLSLEELRRLYLAMAENEARLGQRRNSVDLFKKSLAVKPTAHVLARLIGELHHTQAKPAEIQGYVDQFWQKYPQHPDRFALKSLVGHAYARNKQPKQAAQIWKQLLIEAPRPHDAGRNFVFSSGSKPDDLKQIEQALLEAIGKNQNDRDYLRFTLAFDVYRDRMKDLARARQTALELVSQSPSDDWPCRDAMKWLLSEVGQDEQAEFQRTLQAVVRSQLQHPWLTNFQNELSNWGRDASRKKDTRDRGRAARVAYEQVIKNNLVRLWRQSRDRNRSRAQAARTSLVNTAEFSKAPDSRAMAILKDQGESFRYYGKNEQRARAIPFYGAMVKRFPKNFQAAIWYLEVCYDYAPPEAAQQAAEHLLSLEPQWNSPDSWRRMMGVAEKLKDQGFAERVLRYISKSERKHGLEIGYAHDIGGTLDKFEPLKTAARKYWQDHWKLDRDRYDSRYCVQRMVERTEDQAARLQLLQQALAEVSDFHGWYAQWIAHEYREAKQLEKWAKVLVEARARQDQRPFDNWGIDQYWLQRWVDETRGDQKLSDQEKQTIFETIFNLRAGWPSGSALLALLELPVAAGEKPMQRLLLYQRASSLIGDGSAAFDRAMSFAQAAISRGNYIEAATLLTGVMANVEGVDATRRQQARQRIAQCYSRLGGVGLAIDESSPLAPLLRAALYLRLGDRRLALETSSAHRALFDEHRHELPVDLILFVAENHIAAGGEDNFNRAEDILRGWLIKFSEDANVQDTTKAKVQLLLGRNYFQAQRYDVARSEYTTVLNLYGQTPQAIEAEFGIGECYMAQKVYDQAEVILTKLAGSQNRDVVIRAEFLRGVLANRRGDRDEARTIFRSVLEMVPETGLANKALFNLAGVYEAEQRYIDQLELLRTVGRLGRASKRWHSPGQPLSIVVQDSDLGISRGHTKIPVEVTTKPGGDSETLFLYSGGAGKGLFRNDLQTQLGEVTVGDGILQITGGDTIACDYPEQFKNEFRHVPLADAAIRIASAGAFEAASSKIIDQQEESLSDRLQREALQREQADLRVSQKRPANQIKPGNFIYLRVKDADRDQTSQPDEVIVKLTATSGDSVQLKLPETGPHTGIFVGRCPTGELPAGALATDTAIDHSPLMAIDTDPATTWLSEPDGATPKSLTVDMKDLKLVNQVTLQTPQGRDHSPVRFDLLASLDGQFWFTLGSNPSPQQIKPISGDFGLMTRRIYSGDFTSYRTWNQVIELTNRQPIEQEPAETLNYARPEETEGADEPVAVVWHGKLLQPREGAARIQLQGDTVGLVVDGRLEIPVGPNSQQTYADVYLSQGLHEVVVFSAVQEASTGLGATWARADYNSEQVNLRPFRAADFDLKDPLAVPAESLPWATLSDNAPKPPVADKQPQQGQNQDNQPRPTQPPTAWTFRFEPLELRYVRLVIREYRGEAVAISNLEISGPAADGAGEGQVRHVPTEADVLALAKNDILEIAAGDTIEASYSDELHPVTGDRSQLLSVKLTATYFNGEVAPIAYDFQRKGAASFGKVRKRLMRIDPGDRIIVEITDYDRDQTDAQDTVDFTVAVNQGTPVRFTATETQPYSGVFTKEVDTAAAGSQVDGENPPGKLSVKQGDRVSITYMDQQNTFPGHAVPRETVVYVNKPTDGKIRIVGTRFIPPPAESQGKPQIIYLPPVPAIEVLLTAEGAPQERESTVSPMAFEVPLTVEVFDPDAAKDDRSTIQTKLVTTDGAQAVVECVVSSSFWEEQPPSGVDSKLWALERGRFVGQIILQLGGQNSPGVVPLTQEMPRNLVGRGLPPEEKQDQAASGQTLVARVLNITGKDLVTASYQDARRATGQPTQLTGRGRLIANGELAVVDRDYQKPVEQLRVGEKMFLAVKDADADRSDQRDMLQVEVTSPRGERELVELVETLAHSGEFTASVTLRPADQPTQGNLQAPEPIIETYFGDTLTLKYLDKAASTESGQREIQLQIPVVIGTDGLVAAFSKTFNNEKIAVDTQFHIAESYFELFKSHRKLGRDDEQQADLEAGRRVLREVMEDYPDPKYVPRIAYLLGQFAQELKHWDEAINSYELITRQYPDHMLAADAQFKLAQCYEEADDFDQALEAYVTLAATYPNSPLIANVMVRISEYFWKREEYDVAAQVGEKFLQKFEGHQWAPRMAFRIGQCYHKAQVYHQAGAAFDRFAKLFPDDPLCAESLFWAGEAYRLAADNPQAFQRYNRCRWEHPESDAAKYARGRLQSESMQREFERAAQVEP